MQYLEQVSSQSKASWYRLGGDFQGEVQRWVVSTPETIRICNSPEVCGIEFSDRMRTAMVSALSTAPFREFLEESASDRLCIMNFLRGSLNFDLRNALALALGSNYHATCFMSSQRSRRDGRWVVKEDMYRKMQIPDGGILLVGDVVATGVTVDNGFKVIEEYLLRRKTSLRGIVFFTIGCHKLEKLLEGVHRRFSELFPNYRETHAVYLEGKLRLVDSSTRLMIAIQGTDLIKQQALLAPEFELSQYDDLFAPLERCAIYDAGSRAFDVVEYLDDVTKYWEQMCKLSRRGYTLKEALRERWPEEEYGRKDRFLAAKKASWRGVDREKILSIREAYKERWTNDFKVWASSREALECVCEDRLARLRAVFSSAEGNK